MVTIGQRSPVYARHGMVSSSQPLATEIGLRILKQGGNAVDAAVAVAATLNLTEPCSTGIGGDCFLLYYNAETKRVLGLNGSGCSPAALTREQAVSDFAGAEKAPKFIPRDHGHAVTVPGTVAGWVDALDAWGTLSIARVLEPVIELAKDGYPVSPITAYSWKRGQFQLERGPYANVSAVLLISVHLSCAHSSYKPSRYCQLTMQYSSLAHVTGAFDRRPCAGSRRDLQEPVLGRVF